MEPQTKINPRLKTNEEVAADEAHVRASHLRSIRDPNSTILRPINPDQLIQLGESLKRLRTENVPDTGKT